MKAFFARGIRVRSVLAAVVSAFVILGAVGARAQSAGPDDRKLTDPQAVESRTNAKARPVPIEDLYYTRSLEGASWSPDGKEIVLTMNMAGRTNRAKAAMW